MVGGAGADKGDDLTHFWVIEIGGKYLERPSAQEILPAVVKSLIRSSMV